MTGSKEQYQAMREADLLQQDNAPTLAELEFNRNRYCAGCNINWAHLPIQEGDGEEQYEYCPVCRTDANLEDGRAGDEYFFNEITAAITDQQGKQLELPLLPPPPAINPCENPFDEKRYFALQTEQEQKDNRALKAYMEAMDLDGVEAAEKAYWRAIHE